MTPPLCYLPIKPPALTSMETGEKLDPAGLGRFRVGLSERGSFAEVQGA